MAKRVPRSLTARDAREAYDMWATHFTDPALMANRDAMSNRLKLERVAAQLPLARDAVVLDVGPGDGALFRLIAHRVQRSCGVDPSAEAVRRLQAMFASEPNVEFAVGAADDIPYAGGTFDIVVINSVLQILPGMEVIERALRELVRVCRPGGTIFVGELPFRPEVQHGIGGHLLRKAWESGPRNLIRLLYHVYALPVFRREPIVLYPVSNLHVPVEAFESLCVGLGLHVQTQRHQELRRASTTRNDYVLRVPAGK